MLYMTVPCVLRLSTIPCCIIVLQVGITGCENGQAIHILRYSTILKFLILNIRYLEPMYRFSYRMNKSIVFCGTRLGPRCDATPTQAFYVLHVGRLWKNMDATRRAVAVALAHFFDYDEVVKISIITIIYKLY